MNNSNKTNLKAAIIKTVTEYNSYYEVLSQVIKQYFEDNFAVDWQYFHGWEFSNNGANIVIHYSYEEFGSNTETYMETSYDTVSLDEILEYAQSSQKESLKNIVELK